MTSTTFPVDRFSIEALLAIESVPTEVIRRVTCRTHLSIRRGGITSIEVLSTGAVTGLAFRPPGQPPNHMEIMGVIQTLSSSTMLSITPVFP